MISKATIVITLMVGILTIALPRKYVMIPYIIVACFIPADQRVIIMGADFTVLRILVLFGFMRFIVRSEFRKIKLNTLDGLLIAWAVFGSFIYVLQWSNSAAIVNRSGFLLDTLGLYFIFRIAVSSWPDINLIVRTFAIFAIISAILAVAERVTGINPFSYLGNVLTGIQMGRYRCHGAFPHSIMFGLFWVNIIPLFFGYIMFEKNKVFWINVLIACVIIMIMSGSSTPILSFATAVFFLAGYKFRHYSKVFFWSLCGLLVFIHFVREKPVWHLLARVNVISGSTGWHRYHLIDRAIANFSEWAILGTKSTVHWGYGLQDVTNQYVLEGVRGGFLSMVLFIALMVVAIRSTYKFSMLKIPEKYRAIGWCVCVFLLAHAVSFIGVSYFGQIIMQFYMTLAIAAFLIDNNKQYELYLRRVKMYKAKVSK